jgi:hypothetical protein
VLCFVIMNVAVIWIYKRFCRQPHGYFWRYCSVTLLISLVY